MALTEKSGVYYEFSFNTVRASFLFLQVAIGVALVNVVILVLRNIKFLIAA